MGKRKVSYSYLVGKDEEKGHLEELRIDGRIILKWILNKYNGRTCIRLIWIRTGTSA
jgi:hypothetical protein